MERLLKSPKLVAVTLAFVLNAVSPANANRFASNPDHVVDRSVDVQFAPIGELAGDINKSAEELKHTIVGTGFLISPCYIMTAAHTVFGNDLTPVRGKDYSMTFRAGTSTTSAYAGNTTATPAVAGERTISGGNDWAVMKLTSCIGKLPQFGWLEAAHVNPEGMMGRNLAALGYPADHARGELHIGAGTAVGIEKKTGLIDFTGSAVAGESGGPIMIVENGMIKVAGIFVADRGSVNGATYPTFSAAHTNLVQNAVEVLNNAEIKGLLDADKAAFGQPNPAVERSLRPLVRTVQYSQ